MATITNEATPRKRIFEGDRVLWLFYITLIVFSVLLVYSSAAKEIYSIAANATVADLMRTHLMHIVISMFIVFIVHKTPYKWFKWFGILGYIGCFAMTIVALMMGSTADGAARWIDLGIMMFQPSEGLKVFTIMILALQMSNRQGASERLQLLPNKIKFWKDRKQLKIFRENTVPILGPVCVSASIIFFAHTSSSILVLITSLLMLFVCRIHFGDIVKLSVAGFVLVMAAIFFVAATGIGRSSTALNRIDAWIEENTGDGMAETSYELTDLQASKVAIYEGGAIGKGAGQSSARAKVIHPESDFAYAFFISEYGVVFGLVILAIYLALFFRSLRTIVRQCATTFPALLSAGLGLLITTQALLHMAVQVGLLPETGQPLPLISSGGSSLICTSLAIGMMISMSRPEAHQTDKR